MSFRNSAALEGAQVIKTLLPSTPRQNQALHAGLNYFVSQATDSDIPVWRRTSEHSVNSNAHARFRHKMHIDTDIQTSVPQCLCGEAAVPNTTGGLAAALVMNCEFR